MTIDGKLRASILILLFALVSCGDEGSSDPGDPNPPVDPLDPPPTGSLLADHSAAASLDAIPFAEFTAVADSLRIYYGHTSHGSQLTSGLHMIESADPSYAQPHITEPGGDLGHNGSLTWETTTRAYLATNADYCDVVVWSWCGGASDNTFAGIDIYLNAMNQLELDYPEITFVYMTGHLDGTGVDGTLYANNNRIRDYCETNDKWLFDFADIESYDPDGTYYPDESDGCAWCVDWCATHECVSCGSCAHSHCFNCWRKGIAFWWLLARINGWEG